MLVGISIPNISGCVCRNSIAAVARKAEEIGAHSVWLGDHIVWPTRVHEQRPGESLEDAKYAGALYEVFTTAGYVAALTTRVRIGLGMIVAPYRNLLLTAKMASTLDQLSDGRLELGVAPGYVTGEFRALGIARRRTGALTDDLVELVRAVSASDNPAFTGRTLTVSDVVFRPQPRQERVPVWVGGNSDAALRRAVRVGDGWQAAGMGFEQLRVRLAELHRLANEANRPLVSGLGQRVGRATAEPPLAVSNRIRVRFSARPISNPRGEDCLVSYLTRRPHIEGPPGLVAETLCRFKDELGLSHVVLTVHELDPLDDLLRALDVLGDVVLPAIASASGHGVGQSTEIIRREAIPQGPGTT